MLVRSVVPCLFLFSMMAAYPVEAFADTTPPPAPAWVNDGPVSGLFDRSAFNTDGEVSGFWDVVVDSESGLDYYEYCVGTVATVGCGGLSAVVQWTSSDDVENMTENGLSLTEDVTYFVCVRAVDVATNVGDQQCSDGQVFDLTSPIASFGVLDGSGGDIDWVNSTDEWAANWVEINDSGLAFYEVCVSVENGDDCESSAPAIWESVDTETSVNVDSLSLNEESFYAVCVRGIDTSDNVGAVECSDGAVVDVTAPSLGAIRDGDDTGADSDLSVSSTLIAANWGAASDAGSGVDEYEVCFGIVGDSCSIANWATADDVTSAHLGIALDNGVSYEVCVRAVDVAQNVSSSLCSDGQVTAPSEEEIDDEVFSRGELGLDDSQQLVEDTFSDPELEAVHEYGLNLLPAEVEELEERFLGSDTNTAFADQYLLENPDSVQGVFIDQTNDSLVHVQVTSDLSTHEAAIEGDAPDATRIQVDLVENDEEDLLSLQEVIDEDWATIASAGVDIIETSIDYEQNKVGVGVEELDTSDTTYIENEYNADLVFVYETEPAETTSGSSRQNETHVQAGLRIGKMSGEMLNDGGGVCTSAFVAHSLSTTSEYLFTAGHCNLIPESFSGYWGIGWGSSYNSEAGLGDNVPAAVLRDMDYASVNPSLDVGYFNIDHLEGYTTSKPRVFVQAGVSNQYRDVVGRQQVRPRTKGQLVCYSGGNWLRERCGKIVSPSTSYYDDTYDLFIKRVVAVKGKRSIIGDSGSPVYVRRKDGKAVAAGIISGGSKSPGKIFVYSHIDDVINSVTISGLKISTKSKNAMRIMDRRTRFLSPLGNDLADFSDSQLAGQNLGGVSQTSTLIEDVGDEPYASSYSPVGNDACTKFSSNSLVDFGGNLSVEAWINSTDNGPQFNPTIASRGGGTNNYGNFRFWLTGNEPQKLSFGWRTSGGVNYNKTSTGTISQNTTHHVAATWNASAREIRFYIDGNHDSTAAFTSSQEVRELSTNPLFIGCGYVNPSTGSASVEFQGVIDDPAIFDRVLSATEISEHYIAGS